MQSYSSADSVALGMILLPSLPPPHTPLLLELLSTPVPAVFGHSSALNKYSNNKTNASHTKTMLPTRESVPRPEGNWTTRRPPDHRKETQTAVAWTCFPFIQSGQSHLARHSEREKKTRQIEEEVGRQHQGMDMPGVRQVPEGSGEQRKLEETGGEIICCAPTTLAVAVKV